MMAKFRKKPVVISAMQWDGSKASAGVIAEEMDPTTDALDRPRLDWNWSDAGPPRFFVKTLEGCYEASPGDWIIRGVKGELYPCKPDIFEMTYERDE